MQGIDGVCRLWLPCGGRKWHLAEQWTGARRRARTSEDQRIADEAILNRTRASTIRNRIIILFNWLELGVYSFGINDLLVGNSS